MMTDNPITLPLAHVRGMIVRKLNFDESSLTNKHQFTKFAELQSSAIAHWIYYQYQQEYITTSCILGINQGCIITYQLNLLLLHHQICVVEKINVF